ncbi:MAG: glutathione S-transferase family protein [Burkholderiales bacterium]|nr:glutathione S-transferase family protein [Burkholderiales bacterium]
MMHKLYYGIGACSFVPHAALEAIREATGEAYETQLVKLHKNEQGAPDFLALNPNGQVPVLLVDGRPLTQIVAICDYLDRKYPQIGLMPTDPWQRTEAMSLLAWMNNSVHPTFTHVFMPFKFADDAEAQAELKRYNTANYRRLLERIQGMVALADPWLFGSKVSFLDLYALVLFRWGGLAGVDPDTLPQYKAFVERLARVPAVAAALAREGAPLNMYKKAA